MPRLPAAILDTAAILDILRVPFRHKLHVNIVVSAAALVDDAVCDPRRVWVVTTANVIQEFKANRENVTAALAAEVSKLNQSMARVLGVARLLFPDRRISSLEWPHLDFEQRLLIVMDRLVGSLSLLCGTARCTGRAGQRVFAGRAPASRAEQEFQDWVIFEEFLELASDLAAVDARYAANLDWARARLITLDALPPPLDLCANLKFVGPRVYSSGVSEILYKGTGG